MATVSLRGMEFYSFHGYYEFERRVGNSYSVDVSVNLEIDGDPNGHIDKTINYEDIYRITLEHMQKKYKLLEGLAYDIAHSIKNFDDKANRVEVTLRKLKPQIGGKTACAEVRIVA